MARPPREFVSGALYHIFSRGSNRQAIFSFDSDRQDFLMCLGRVVRQHDLRCLAYCLMPNHYHLLIETPGAILSSAMKTLNGRYSRRFNGRYGRDSHLFKNRFGAVHQEAEAQLLFTLRYIVRNPVESALCARPDEWPWSSYRACAGLEPPASFLDLGAVLSYFGDEPHEAMSRYLDAMDGAGAASPVSDTADFVLRSRPARDRGRAGAL